MAPPGATPAHPAEHPQGASLAPAQGDSVLPSIEKAPSETLQGTAATPEQRSSETPQSIHTPSETETGPSSSPPPHTPLFGNMTTPETLGFLAREALAISPTAPSTPSATLLPDESLGDTDRILRQSRPVSPEAPLKPSPTLPPDGKEDTDRIPSQSLRVSPEAPLKPSPTLPPDDSSGDMDRIPSQSLGDPVLDPHEAWAQEEEPAVKFRVEEGITPGKPSTKVKVEERSDAAEPSTKVKVEEDSDPTEPSARVKLGEASDSTEPSAKVKVEEGSDPAESSAKVKVEEGSDLSEPSVKTKLEEASDAAEPSVKFRVEKGKTPGEPSTQVKVEENSDATEPSAKVKEVSDPAEPSVKAKVEEGSDSANIKLEEVSDSANVKVEDGPDPVEEPTPTEPSVKVKLDEGSDAAEPSAKVKIEEGSNSAEEPTPDDIADIEAKIDDSPPLFDIVLVRHLKSVSNTVTPKKAEARHLLYMTPEQLVQWAYHDVNNGTAGPIRRGEFMWDGLTEHSIDQTREIAKIWAKLPGVKGVLASMLTRAIQTANLIFPSHVTFVDDALIEGTNWPHDYPGLWYLEDGQPYVSYIQLKGGDGPDCGTPVKRVKVKMDNAFPVNGQLLQDITEDITPEEMQKVLAGRMVIALEMPTQEALEARAEKARRVIWALAKRLQRHFKNVTEDISKCKLVVVVHGGFLNFITRDFNCGFKRENEQQDWEWNKSCVLKNGDAIVYRFQPTEDDKFRLVEKPEDPEYRKVLGDHYKVLANMDREYRNPDGEVLDHKEWYMKFNNRVGRDVRQTYLQDPEVMKYLLGVPGPAIGGLWREPVQEMPEYLRQAIANAARARREAEERAQQEEEMAQAVEKRIREEEEMAQAIEIGRLADEADRAEVRKRAKLAAVAEEAEEPEETEKTEKTEKIEEINKTEEIEKTEQAQETEQAEQAKQAEQGGKCQLS